MKLAEIAKTIIQENEIQVDDLSQSIEISELGLRFLKEKIAKLNEKALRWGVPKMELKIISERKEPVKRKDIWGREELVREKIFYTVSIIGDTPKVEGYTFIAKVQHSTGGENILNIAPGSTVRNLPEIYRTAKSECDVCKQSRERFNTFILQLDKEDQQRFSDKKVGDLIQVGSACLKRFLPGISVDALIHYAQMLEDIRAYKRGSEGDWDDEGGEGREPGAPNAYRDHIYTETIMKYICLVYVVRGKYIPKSKADFDNIPTSQEALSTMFDFDLRVDDEHKGHVQKMAESNPSLIKQAEELRAKVVNWMKNTNFTEMVPAGSEWSDYYHNLNVVSKASTISSKNIGYLAGVFQNYLKKEGMKEKEAAAKGKGYIGKVGERVSFNGLVRGIRSFESSFARGAMVYLYTFEDLDGNNVKWFSSKDMGFQEGERYPLTGKVKTQEIDKYTKQPTTVVTHVKREVM
jgi:hypothetical protein